MIELKNFSIGFDSRKLLDNVNTIFPSCQLTALIGRNGSGKSTMMKAVCGLNDRYSGDIIIKGENLKDIPRSKLATLVSYVNTQRPRMANLKCNEVVALGRTPYTNWHGKLSSEDKNQILEAIDLVGMRNYYDRDFNSLSDGESQKIMIARAIAQDTPIIILDEPTSFLDMPTRFELANLLRKLDHEKGKTIIFSTHELDLALKICDRIALVDKGNLYNLPASEMAASSFLKDLFDNYLFD